MSTLISNRLATRPLPDLALVPTDDREARYQAALKLVERIEKNLSCSRRRLYWRVSDKQPLTTVMEVVNAMVADDLLLPEPKETVELAEAV